MGRDRGASKAARVGLVSKLLGALKGLALAKSGQPRGSTAGDRDAPEVSTGNRKALANQLSPCFSMHLSHLAPIGPLRD